MLESSLCDCFHFTKEELIVMPTEGKPILFPVNVSLKEGPGRVVEGKARGHTLAVDLLSSWGGGDSHACPLETLAFALGACFVATARTWAIREQLPIDSISADVQGTVDLTKGMGKEGKNRLGFPSMKISVKLDSPLPEETKRDFLKRVASLCPVCDTIELSTPIELELQHDS
jgi:uncharacterized OsmC-like protein